MELAHDRRGEGPALVLLHGIGSHRQAWTQVADLLADERDVVAVDLPGFGASPPLPAGTPYTPEALADAVEAFCAGIGLARWHVAGNSLGGYLALELAARGTVRSATALSPVGFWSRAELRYARAVLRLAREAAEATPPERMAMMAGSRVVRAASFGLFAAHPTRMTPAAAVASSLAMAEAPGFDETLDSLTWLMPPGPPKAPITIAWGERDRLLRCRQAVRAGRWSGQRVKLLKGCGHVPMIDDPGLVTRVLLEGSRAG